MGIIYGQETWLYPHLGFVIDGYDSERCNRGDNPGGRCATFIKTGTIENFEHMECDKHKEERVWFVMIRKTGGIVETTGEGAKNAQEAAKAHKVRSSLI